MNYDEIVKLVYKAREIVSKFINSDFKEPMYILSINFDTINRDIAFININSDIFFIFNILSFKVKK